MATPTGSPPRKSQRLEGVVALTEYSRDVADKDTCVLVGDRLRLQASVRSDLLSGIRNTSGVASLPGNISAVDIQLWQAACLVSCQPSTTECVTILKVRPVADRPSQTYLRDQI